ncbi:MAG TPA: BsuPI-related putative proteinase inhibitor [Longimicrobium sp.]|nr:BsuPI-related putative proteinase inhibitor [Longimicrobium sp.]
MLARRAAALLLFAMAACHSRVPAPAAEGSAAPGPLVTSLQVEPSPDSVRFVLQVTNASAEPVELRFNSGQRYDFAARDDAGREAWRWSAGQGFIQVLGSETLAPGQTVTHAESWRPGAEWRGRELTGVGRLTSSSHPAERTVRFRVP